jgi:DNA-binding response OmpR family regulator
MLTGRRILIVEDDPIIGLDLARTVLSAGMSVVGIAATTNVAQQLLHDNVIDAAVLDVRLEIGDTLDFAKQLQAQNIPYLFQTSDPDLVAGYFSPPPIVLAKPYPPEKLIAALRELFLRSFS